MFSVVRVKGLGGRGESKKREKRLDKQSRVGNPFGGGVGIWEAPATPPRTDQIPEVTALSANSL